VEQGNATVGFTILCMVVSMAVAPAWSLASELTSSFKREVECHFMLFAERTGQKRVKAIMRAINRSMDF
jgi:hypothetical protein